MSKTIETQQRETKHNQEVKKTKVFVKYTVMYTVSILQRLQHSYKLREHGKLITISLSERFILGLK